MFLTAKYLKKPFIIWSEQIDYQIVRDRREYIPAGVLKKIGPFLARHLQHLIFYVFAYGATYVKRHCDAYLAAGKKTEEHLMRLGAKGPFFRHGSTIDTVQLQQEIRDQKVADIRQRLGIGKKKVILSVSYLQKRKGVQYLIEAFLRLNRQDAVLLIVGDGEYRSELCALVPEYRNDILFLGYDNKPAKYYAIADIFAMPSFSDPWGLTVNEAMVAGLPVITTTNVGAQELIQGNGFLIPPRDSLALQTALETLINDKPLRQRMGRRSQEIIRSYTIEHTADVCHQAILSVVKS
jgi:glycosyltransferase involved in cell wall biosynthesis